LLEKTVVIFTADHGESLGSHGGLVDKGWHHFEETHRIPLIIRFPDARHAGRVVDEFASLADVYPTILDIAHAAPSAQEVHGQCLTPLLAGTPDRWRDQIVTEFNGLNEMTYTQRTVRWDRYKFGFNCGSRDELYDLDVDPYEMTNVAGQPDYTKIVEEGRQRLRAWMSETNDPARYLYDRMSHW
jgi:arylsulfatase A-like enzyme